MVVAATNIRIYRFLVDLPVGHYQMTLPPGVTNRPYLEDVYPHKQDNLCLFRCIVKQLKPQECQVDHEKRVKLM